MKNFIVFLCLLLPVLAFSQEKPAYCDELPVSYEKGAWTTVKGGSPVKKSSLPRFKTVPVRCYKIQVAILKFTSPENYPFHESLIARHRPCEEVWVVESKQCFDTRAQANVMKDKLKRLGYKGAYVVELIAWERQ
jgi:hypothetical protein